MQTKIHCQHCGKPLGPEAIEGLCPECLMKVGLGSGTEAGTALQGQRGFTPPTVAELAAKFPQLEILAFIGQGGMGAVYKARQKQLERLVALKILSYAAQALANYGDQLKDVRPILIDLQKDPDLQVRRTVTNLLNKATR